jgi:hypothetical protein
VALVLQGERQWLFSELAVGWFRAQRLVVSTSMGGGRKTDILNFFGPY